MSLSVIGGGVAGTLGALGICELITAQYERRRVRRQTNSRIRRILMSALLFMGNGLGKRAPKGMARRLDAAGLDIPAWRFMAIKTGVAFTSLAAGLLFSSDMQPRAMFLLCGLLPTVAFLSPDIWLVKRSRERATIINDELADVVELLRVALGAGLGLEKALAEVGYRQHGLLAQELKQAARSLACGESYESVLDRLERRCPTAGTVTTVSAIQRAQRHGTSLAEPLAAIIQQARTDSSRRALEAAAKAAPKIQLIVTLLLVPSVLLLIAAAMIPVFLSR